MIYLQFRAILARLCRNDCGATAIEYSILLAIIVTAIVAGGWFVGQGVKTFYDDTASQVVQATSGE